MKKMGKWDAIAMWLVIIGGLNWGLVGLFKYDLVSHVFGDESFLTRVIFVLIGLSAAWMLMSASKMRKR